MLFGRTDEPPDPSTVDIRRILLASEGRPIQPSAVDFVVSLAHPAKASVHVISIARVWGTSLGFPNPGLLPTRQEWDEQRKSVTAAVRSLERRGVEAGGRVLATRRATRGIVREAERLGCDAIVMTADARRSRVLADLMWSQEPYRVRRRARVPVYLVPS